MRVLGVVLRVLLALAYPAVIYLVAARWGARAVGLAVLALAGPRIVVALRDAPREHLRHALSVPLTVGALGLLSALVRDVRFVLAMPALVNAALFANFALSLRTETPLIERFARMQVGDLSTEERAWCRGVTVVWSVFLALNGCVCAALAVAAPLSWWALYTGLLSYLLIGALFTVEYVLRSLRFRRYGGAPHDRLMAWIAPPRAARGAA